MKNLEYRPVMIESPLSVLRDLVIQVRLRSAPNNLIFRPELLVYCIRWSQSRQCCHHWSVRDGGPLQDDQSPDHVVQLRNLHQPPIWIRARIQRQAA